MQDSKFDKNEDGRIIGGFINKLFFSKIALHGLSMWLAYNAGITLISDSFLNLSDFNTRLCAFALAFVFELLVYFLLPYPVAMLVRGRWGKGTRLFIVLMSVVGLTIVLLSPMYSFIGTYRASEQLSPDSSRTNTDTLEQAYQLRIDSIHFQFNQSKRDLDTRFAELRKVTSVKYDALVAEQEGIKTEYQKLYNNGHKWAIGHVKKAKQKIKNLDADLAKELASIEEDNLAEHKNLKDDRKLALTAIEVAKSRKLSYIDESDNEKISLAEKIKRAGGFILVLAAIASMLLLLLFSIIEERYYYKIGEAGPGDGRNKRGGKTSELFSVINAQKDRAYTSLISFLATGLDSHSKTMETTEEQRRKIGFAVQTGRDDKPIMKGDDTSAYENRMGTIEKTKLRICHHCNTNYIYNHAKQKFCSTKCRKANWKQVNGRDPMMKKRKG